MQLKLANDLAFYFTFENYKNKFIYSKTKKILVSVLGINLKEYEKNIIGPYNVKIYINFNTYVFQYNKMWQYWYVNVWDKCLISNL